MADLSQNNGLSNREVASSSHDLSQLKQPSKGVWSNLCIGLALATAFGASSEAIRHGMKSGEHEKQAISHGYGGFYNEKADKELLVEDLKHVSEEQNVAIGWGILTGLSTLTGIGLAVRKFIKES